MRDGLRYTDEEFAVIAAAATSCGMTPGAWAQQAAYRAALAHRDGGHSFGNGEKLVDELRQQRRVLANVGGNLNDLARAANSTGQLGEARAIGIVLRLVSNTVQSCGELIDRVRAELPR